MTSAEVIDPYHGRREHWPISLLNAASQRSSIVFLAKAVRAMPARDQITLPIREHFEVCGPDELVSCACAAGLVDPRDVDATIIDAAHWIEARFGIDIAKTGTNTEQLIAYAQHRGWAVRVDSTPSGDLDMILLGQGLVGLTALNTAYGSGPAWNDLHPQQGGRVGHYEGIGAVDATHLDVMEETVFTAQDIANAFARVGFAISKNTDREPTPGEESFWAGKALNAADPDTHGSVDLMLARIIDQSGGPG